MTLHISKVYDLSCDSCGEYSGQAWTASRGESRDASTLTRREARDGYGWVRRDGKDLCPRCQPRAAGAAASGDRR